MTGFFDNDDGDDDDAPRSPTPISGTGGIGSSALSSLLAHLTGQSGGGSSSSLPQQPQQASSQDVNQLSAQLGANAGKLTMPGQPSGGVVMPPLSPPGSGFDPFTYGQNSGEATFFGRMATGGFAPLAAALGIGTGQLPGSSSGLGGGSGSPAAFLGFTTRVQNGKTQINAGGKWKTVPDLNAPFGGLRTRVVNGRTQVRAGGKWHDVPQ